MKTLKLSSIALLLSCTFACKKSSDVIDGQAQQNRTEKPTIVAQNVQPVLEVTFNPATAVLNQPVTVTARIIGVDIPNCGKLDLEVKVGSDFQKLVGVDVSETVHEVSFVFTPTVAGDNAYEFKAHYVAQGCDGFAQSQQEGFFLDVTSCTGLGLTGVASAEPAENAGEYYFTVNYTVTTCGIEYDKLKTQGAVTAWTSAVQVLTDGYESWTVGNNESHPNTITKWEETAPLPANTRTYSIKFKKAWSGTGTVELTGQWSVKAVRNGVEVGVAEFAPIVYPQ